MIKLLNGLKYSGTIDEMEDYISDELLDPPMLEQLAEEASELAQAALKYARFLRKENPVSDKYNEDILINNLLEEYTDVYTVGHVLGLFVNEPLHEEKLQRWYNRLSVKE